MPGRTVLVWFAVAALSSAALEPAHAQAVDPARPSVPAPVGLDVLEGVWVRPDGGYTIVIRNVGREGRLEAMYFNPDPLPFEKAQAVKSGTTIRANFELRAGGYAGSTYDLTYDPASDRLTGVYYQAVAKQHFDVHFTRQQVPIR